VNRGAVDHIVRYDYDSQTGRLQIVTHGDGAYGIPARGFTRTYVPNSNLPASVSSVYLPTTTYQWEPYRDALKSVTHTTGDGTQTWLKVEYGNVGAANSAINDIGQRERATYSGAIYHTVNPAPSPGHSIFAYNANGEVVADQRKDATGTAIAGRSYNYDPIGNRLGSAFDGGGTTTYLPNLLNQYQAVTRGATTTNPLHDLDGNLVNDGSKVYVWDAENRLSEVRRASDNALIASYRYDYMSRRIQKKTTTAAPQGAGETLFHYDGWNLLAEYEVDGTSLEILRTYTWGPDLSGSMQGAGGVGGLLAMDEKDGYSVHHPLYDGNGNILAMIQGTTSIISFVSAIYEYDAFGNTVFMDDGFPEENPFRFSTKYFDKETGFYYYGYRYYDPVTGRWPSRDPIEEWGGLNLYGFGVNSGINNIDYLGLQVPLRTEEEKKQHLDNGIREFSGLSIKLKEMMRACCLCCLGGDAGADAIQAEILRLWTSYYGRGHRSGGPDEVGGYLCYHWAKGFSDGVKREGGNCFGAELTMGNEFYYSKDDNKMVAGIREHWWVVIRACPDERGGRHTPMADSNDSCTIVIDDGWLNRRFVHKASTYGQYNPSRGNSEFRVDPAVDAEKLFEIRNSGRFRWRNSIR
jgi:RHS repeat-associated protein